jgi:hypothetical protein
VHRGAAELGQRGLGVLNGRGRERDRGGGDRKAG